MLKKNSASRNEIYNMCLPMCDTCDNKNILLRRRRIYSRSVIILRHLLSMILPVNSSAIQLEILKMPRNWSVSCAFTQELT